MPTLDVSSLPDLYFNCNSCQCKNSHKLPFSSSSLSTSSPLEVVCTDVWTSPIISVNNYKYYIIFVDHFTKYIWLYPLKWKSDTRDVFIKFKALAEKFFSRPIITLYSNNGEEYQALSSFLTINGVSHLKLHLTYLNTMGTSNAVIVTLLKPVSLYSLMLPCLYHIGLLLSPPLSISSTAFPHLLYKSSPIL